MFWNPGTPWELSQTENKYNLYLISQRAFCVRKAYKRLLNYILNSQQLSMMIYLKPRLSGKLIALPDKRGKVREDILFLPAQHFFNSVPAENGAFNSVGHM